VQGVSFLKCFSSIIYGFHALFHHILCITAGINIPWFGHHFLYIPLAPLGLMETFSYPPKRTGVSGDVGEESDKKLHASIAGEWHALIGGTRAWSGPGYSSRQLTYRSDRLPALSGLVYEVHKVIKCNYLAGILECHILAGLLWRRVRGSRFWSEPCTSMQDLPQDLGDPQALWWGCRVTGMVVM
jgi:hypothetical protein